MIRAENIKKTFNDNEVLKGINTVFESGKTNLIIGRSGAGKTVLLKILVGLIEPTEGSIWYDDVDFTALAKEQVRTIRMQVGMLFQGSALFDSMTVEQNIRFGLNADFPKSSIDAVLQEVMLETAHSCLPKQLSGGMAQRVAIARALVREPDVLLMDEPFSSLDVLTRRSLHALTRTVTDKHQTATVIVTHDPEEAVNLANRVLVLANPNTNDGIGASIQHDFRPAGSFAERRENIEAIITALNVLSPANANRKAV